MFNCVRKEDIDYSPYDEGEWRYVIFAVRSSDLLLLIDLLLLVVFFLSKFKPSCWFNLMSEISLDP